MLISVGCVWRVVKPIPRSPNLQDCANANQMKFVTFYPSTPNLIRPWESLKESLPTLRRESISTPIVAKMTAKGKK